VFSASSPEKITATCSVWDASGTHQCLNVGSRFLENTGKRDLRVVLGDCTFELEKRSW